MYSERKDNFSVKDIIVQILCILLFVFLLLWLFPTKSFIKNNVNGNSYLSDNEQIVDTIFNYNVQTMKEAAIGYYTTSRLPINIGDTDIMTLRDMLSEKLILSFLDSNNKQCDLDNSYVQITKQADEYVLKVNLVCPASKSDYILVHLGCYDYCKGSICEKKTTTTNKSKKSNSSVKVDVNNNNKVEVNTQSNRVDVDQSISNNINVDANNSVVDINITNNNNTVINQDNRTVVNTPVISVTRYQYSKDLQNCNWSAWSDWTTKELKSSSTVEVDTKTEKEFDETKGDTTTPICKSSSATLTNKNKSCTITNSSLVSKVCPSGYEYNSSYGKCVSTTANSSVLKSSTSAGTWSTPKRAVYSSAQTTTSTTKYEYVSIVYGVDSCDGCKYSINYIYNVSTYTAGKTTYSCSDSSYKLINNKCYHTTSYDNGCSNSKYTYTNGTCEYTVDSICPSGYTKNSKGTKCVKDGEYVNVKYYRSRTYTCETVTVYEYSESSYDTALISQGYKYTGKSF